MNNCPVLRTDETLRELTVHGTPDFPLEFYLDAYGGNDCLRYDWHWHPEFELGLVESGELDCQINGRRITLSAGEAIWINARQLHRFEARTEAWFPNLLFAPDFIGPQGSLISERFIAPILESGHSHRVFHAGTDWESDLLHLLKAAVALCKVPNSTYELDLHALLCRFWSIFFEHTKEDCATPEQNLSQRAQARLLRMTDFINIHYPSRITLQDIAQAANISKSEALRCFRLCIGASPVDFLIEHRLSQARKLLLETEDSISSIAAAVGIENISYFDRIFRRKYGVSPLEARNQKRVGSASNSHHKRK